MTVEELPIVFSCQTEQLIGFIHKPNQAFEIGVLIVVGGPQYRVGSHRQFVLLARMLANNGIPVMRFDYRGMGDSQGQVRSFSDIDDDIRSAVDVFFQNNTDLRRVVIWGLCDAASAATFYAYQDERVKGLVLLNPWVFTEQGAAKTYLKYYYLQRLLNPELWRKVFSLQFNYRQSFASFLAILKNILGSADNNKPQIIDSGEISLVDSNLSLPDRVRECLLRYKSPVLFILSGKDLTADEFREVIKEDKWQKILMADDVSVLEIMEADHTFSSHKWREKVSSLTLQWIKNLH